MNIKIAPSYAPRKKELLALLNTFESYESQFGTGKRNDVKVMPFGAEKVVVKSFKIPNRINRLVYRFFRPSKARRSFEYATKLLTLGVNTPSPIAYVEHRNLLGLKESYYISAFLESDLTFRDLIEQPEMPDHERILRAFTQFTSDLHQKEILFLDHSPGNTLIQKEHNGYRFYLVDLNRMHFKPLSLDERIKNFSRLTPKREMIQIMSEEYANLNHLEVGLVHQKMLQERLNFEKKKARKKKLKKKYLGRK